jgi:hypothetical protein
VTLDNHAHAVGVRVDPAKALAAPWDRPPWSRILVLVMVWNDSGDSNLPFPTAIAVVSVSWMFVVWMAPLERLHDVSQ